MTITLSLYQERRDALLAEIIAALSNDERFVAGWLTGSFGRNTADSVSDIDINIVVSDIHGSNLCLKLESVSAQISPERYSLFSQFGSNLCLKLESVSAQISPERYSLFSQFGMPALIHENNNNAPEGGTFTFVLYSESAIMVDWVLVPQSKAIRPYESQLLFDKASITISYPPQLENLNQRKKSIAEKWAFFWMMAAITIKYIIRGDGVFVAHWIENLHSLIREIERQINEVPRSYTRGSLSQLQTTREKQMEALKQLCKKMQDIKPKVAEFSGSEALLPLEEIETLFSLVNK